MDRYVAGFLFNDERTKVTLVHKLKFPPGSDWTLTPLNGVGGKIEENEEPEEAMQREFEEEAGVSIPDWNPFVVLTSIRWEVTFFMAFSTFAQNSARTIEKEPIVTIPVSDLSRCVPNLNWLIPMALDRDLINVASVWNL